ncbi:MAG: hypothetical protein AAF125_02580 [Chloroflexota bacterium]
MLDDGVRSISDRVYGVEAYVNKLERENDGIKILVASATKARKFENGTAGRFFDLRWSFARRAVVVLTDEQLFCRDWVIPLKEVKEASVSIMRSMIGSRAMILSITKHDGTSYWFGLDYNSAWLEQDVLDIEKQPMNRAVVILRGVLRIGLLGYLAYTLFQILT